MKRTLIRKPKYVNSQNRFYSVIRVASIYNEHRFTLHTDKKQYITVCAWDNDDCKSQLVY